MMHVDNENKSRLFATVLSPIGKTWNIKLTRDHSETFFKGGWPEFSKFHNLEVGFKLVFRYEGNMVFNVKVFGLNGCLKDYNQDAVAILRRSGFNASREKSPAKCASVTEGKGWKEFCVKNNIKCGDTCTLEIIAKNEILVTISKAAKTVEASDVKSDV
ncbi:putative B3 domain-containing protein [Carex littledalei]|uniref:Putative B3 domain-containing protein n=1 Tax=Carex littledalei TaxID=544730 RepID=A0A833R9D9_9POAL|nr:putative B3 domain-containing protein [Carex littledalei]